MKNQIDQSTPFLAFYDLLRIRGIYSDEEKREKLRRGFRRAMALAAVLVGLALPQSAWARPRMSGALPAGVSLSADEKTMTISSGSSFTWDEGFNIAGDEKVDITAGNTVHRDTSGSGSSIAGTLDAHGASFWILNPNGISVSTGAHIDNVSGFLAAALSDDNISSGFHLNEVGDGTIDLGGKGGSSYTVAIGKTLSGLPSNALVVNTTGMTGDGTISVAPSGGKITFNGITLGNGSVAKAGDVEFDTTSEMSDGSSVTADANVGGINNETGVMTAGSGTGSILGMLNQSGGSATAGRIAALNQTAAGAVANTAEITGVANQTAGTINAGSATAMLSVGAGSTLGAGNVTAGTVAVGSDGSGGLTLAGNQLNGKTINAGAVTLAGATGGLEYNVSGNISSIGTSGNAAGKVTVNNGKELTLGAIEASSLDVTAGGAVTQSGAANVSGATMVTAKDASNAAQDITLTQANNKFGSIGATGANVQITESDAVALGVINASALTVTAGGAVSQVANTALTVSDATTVKVADGSNVTLANDGNKFGSIGVVGKTADTGAAGEVTIVDSDSTLALNATRASKLDVTAAGAITQNGAVKSTEKTTLSGSSITLERTDNDIGTKLGATASDGNVSIVNNGAIRIEAGQTVSGKSVSLEARGAEGYIFMDKRTVDSPMAVVSATDASDGTITLASHGAIGEGLPTTGIYQGTGAGIAAKNLVVHAAKDDGTALDVALNRDGESNVNSVQTLSGDGGSVNIKTATALELGALTVASLDATAGGAVTQTAAANVSGDTSVKVADGSNVTLDNTGNKLGAIAVSGNSENGKAGQVTIVDSEGDIDLTNVKAATGITANAAGTVRVQADSTVETGALDVTAKNGDIDLKTKVGFVKAQADSGSVTITDKSDAEAGKVLTVKGATASGNVTIISEKNGVLVSQDVSAGTGTGGTLAISGAEINASVTAGTGKTATIQGQSPDIILGANLGSDNDTINLSANRDIVVKSDVTVAGKTVSLTADSDNAVNEPSIIVDGGASVDSHAGGVYIAGTVRAADGNAQLSGKELHWVDAPDAAKGKGVYFNNGTVAAAGDITILDKSGADTFQTGGMSLTASGGAINLGAGGGTPEEPTPPSGIEKAIQATGAVTLSQKDALELGNVVSTGTAALRLESSDGAVTTAETSSGAMTVNALKGAVKLGTIASASSLTVNAGGDVKQAEEVSATVTGAVQVNAAGQNVTLANDDNSFGSVGVTGANVEIKEKDAVALHATTASGTFNVTAGGNITQSGDVSATGTTTLDAGANAITLNRDGNDFGGTVTVQNTPASVNIHDANALDVAAVTTAGSVELVAGGALTTQAVTANNGSATLRGASVTTGGAVTASGANSDATITATGGAAQMGGTVTAGRDASISGTAGANTTAGAVTAARNATINAGNGSAQVAAVTATGGDAALVGGAGGTTVGGNVTAGGNAVVVSDGGAATINAGNTIQAANVGLQGATVANDGTISGVNQLAIVQTGGAAMTLTDDDIPTGAQTIGIQSAGDLTVDSTHDLVFGNASVTAAGRTVAANGLASTAGTVDVSSDGNIQSSAITGAEGTTVETRNGGAINVAGNLGQGGDTVVNANGAAVTANTLASGGGGLLDVNGAGAVNANIAAGGDAQIQAGSLQAGNTQTGGNLTFDTVTGAADVGNLAVGGDVNGTVGGQFTTAGGNVGSIGQQGGAFQANGGFQQNGVLNTGAMTVQAGNYAMNGDLNAGGAAVNITAGGGIQGGGNLLTAGALTLAGGDIGGTAGTAGNALQVNTINLQQITGGNVYLVDTAVGQIAITAITANGGNLEFEARNATVQGGGTLSAANGNLTLRVNDQFGELGNPVNVVVGGTLTIDGVDVPMLHIVIDGDADPGDLMIVYNADGFAIWGNDAKGYQIVGAGPSKQRLINRALAFTVNTPELKSKQGIFGDPAFVHTRMNVSEARSVANMDMLALNAVDFYDTWEHVQSGEGRRALRKWAPKVDMGPNSLLSAKLAAQASEMETQPEVWVPGQAGAPSPAPAAPAAE